MTPVAVALLATLLPTVTIILLLTILCLHLYVKLKAARAPPEILEPQPQLTTETQLKPESLLPTPPPVSLPVKVRPTESPFISEDAFKPNWRMDLYSVFDTFWVRCNEKKVPLGYPNTEEWVKERLDAVGYDGAPPRLVMKLLANEKARPRILEQIGVSVALAKTDLKSESSSTVLSLSPEFRADLLKGFKALEGISFGSEFSELLSKIPSQIADDHEMIDKDKLQKVIDDLQMLYVPFVGGGAHGCYWVGDRELVLFFEEKARRAFNCLVKIQLRMLVSRQKFSYKWGEISEKAFCSVPELWSYLGEDGLLLNKPRLWSETEYLDIKDDGSAKVRTPDCSAIWREGHADWPKPDVVVAEKDDPVTHEEADASTG